MALTLQQTLIAIFIQPQILIKEPTLHFSQQMTNTKITTITIHIYPIFHHTNGLTQIFTISHEEAISPIAGQENKVEDRHGYNVIQLANDAALEFLNAPNYIISPFKSSFSNLGYLKTNKRENNALKKYKEDRYFGTLNSLKPIEGLLFPSTKFDAYRSSL